MSNEELLMKNAMGWPVEHLWVNKKDGFKVEIAKVYPTHNKTVVFRPIAFEMASGRDVYPRWRYMKMKNFAKQYDPIDQQII